MYRRLALSLVFGLGFTVAACGDNGGTTPQQDAAVQQDAPTQYDVLPPVDTLGAQDRQRDSASDNDSFENAKALTINTPFTQGVIETDSDIDYFKFEGTAGQWLMAYTEAQQLASPSPLDTILTVYGPDQQQVAACDDDPFGNTYDSTIFFRIPADGTYYVSVQDWNAWSGGAPKFGPTYKYSVTVAEIGLTNPGVTADAEGGDDPTTAQAVSFVPVSAQYPEILVATFFGTFRDASDVDVYSFSLPGVDAGLTAEQFVTFDLYPSGSEFTKAIEYAPPYPGGVNGSTSRMGQMWIANAAGDPVIAKIDDSNPDPQQTLQVSLAQGDYLLFVKHPGAVAGSNDFYVMQMSVNYYMAGDEDSEGPGGTAGNDQLADADPLTVAASTTNPDNNRATVEAHLSATDADYYSFTVRSTDTITVACWAALIGSGLEGLTVSVRDSTDTELAGGSATESATASAFLQELTPAAAGTYYIKLTATGQSTTVTGNYARCGLTLGPPAP